MNWKLSALMYCIACVASAAATAQEPAQVQDGPAGYTIACAIHKAPGVPDVRHCADLGSAQRCEHEAELASQPSKEATGMTIVNRSDQSIKIYWLNFSGFRVLYHTVAPGGRITQQTFIGHNWLVLSQDGYCVGIFNASPIAIAFF
jgi:hypothetical protein